jgi:Tol biopolymer transport system component
MESLDDLPRVVGQGTDPCLSPDGKQIAFTRKSGAGYSIWVMNPEGRKLRPLKTHPNRLGAVVPTWSPDGHSLLYSGQVDEALEIFVCNAGSGKSQQLTDLGKASTSAAWSPDGQWISFRVADTAFWCSPGAWRAAQKRRDTLRPVCVVRADGADVQPLAALRYQCATDGSRAVWRPGCIPGKPTDAHFSQLSRRNHLNSRTSP